MMYKDDAEVMRNFYHMPKPDPKHMKERMKKVASVIATMGDKYCLAIPVEKKNG